MIRAHGIIGLLPKAAQQAFAAARIAAGDHRPAIHDADPVPAALTAEAGGVFRHQPRGPATGTEDQRLARVLALAEDLRVMHRIEVLL